MSLPLLKKTIVYLFLYFHYLFKNKLIINVTTLIPLQNSHFIRTLWTSVLFLPTVGSLVDNRAYLCIKLTKMKFKGTDENMGLFLYICLIKLYFRFNFKKPKIPAEFDEFSYLTAYSHAIIQQLKQLIVLTCVLRSFKFLQWSNSCFFRHYSLIFFCQFFHNRKPFLIFNQVLREGNLIERPKHIFKDFTQGHKNTFFAVAYFFSLLMLREFSSCYAFSFIRFLTMSSLSKELVLKLAHFWTEHNSP